MLHVERKEQILNFLQSRETVSVQELVSAVGASESTIRRDLTELESEHYIKRLHGGASLLKRKLEEPSIAEKQSTNQKDKKALAAEAASLVKERDCIFLDAGTTTVEMIPHLTGKDIVVVTNGIPHVPLLLERGIQTYVTGGKAKPGTSALTGEKAVMSMHEFRFDTCFLGMNGVDAVHGYTTPDPEEAFVKKTALSLSSKSWVLADPSKMGETSFASVAQLEKAAVLTSDSMDEKYLEQLQQRTEVKVVKL
ncbi:DeoR/GlpR family DNA-binding transcription regulator [Salibacterium qingdaonense]|uniref:Transcriptional regulator, DeoR family n=1 Tax=Salibacterium qingdaonense TaxID=266892 RepID=A0A1I4MXZ8_9BACI|nr:DeoR/GlpR family DNA-binding transcription regulator [Salibacterium qingdaonense]SFM08159.1 transcriptional regulator, DeoR family [Salibacterium qingdaonense]